MGAGAPGRVCHAGRPAALGGAVEMLLAGGCMAQSQPDPDPSSLPLAPTQVRHSHQEILNVLFEGLRRLEYRGYDSAGGWCGRFVGARGCLWVLLARSCAGRVASLCHRLPA